MVPNRPGGVRAAVSLAFAAAPLPWRPSLPWPPAKPPWWPSCPAWPISGWWGAGGRRRAAIVCGVSPVSRPTFAPNLQAKPYPPHRAPINTPQTLPWLRYPCEAGSKTSGRRQATNTSGTRQRQRRATRQHRELAVAQARAMYWHAAAAATACVSACRASIGGALGMEGHLAPKTTASARAGRATAADAPARRATGRRCWTLDGAWRRLDAGRTGRMRSNRGTTAARAAGRAGRGQCETGGVPRRGRLERHAVRRRKRPTSGIPKRRS